jgi:hypothetical protein
MTRRLLFSCLLLAAFALACDDHDDGPPTLSASIDPSTVEQGSVTTLSVTVTNFILAGHGAAADDHHDDDAAPDEGHYHVYLDTTEDNPILMGETPTSDLTIDAAPGDHELIVRLHDLQHVIIQPEVKVVLPLTVLAGAGGAGGAGGSGGAGGAGGAGGN